MKCDLHIFHFAIVLPDLSEHDDVVPVPGLHVPHHLDDLHHDPVQQRWSSSGYQLCRGEDHQENR